MASNGAGPSSLQEKPQLPAPHDLQLKQLFNNLPQLLQIASEGKMSETQTRQLQHLITLVKQKPDAFPQYTALLAKIPANLGAALPQPLPQQPSMPTYPLRRTSPDADPSLVQEPPTTTPALTTNITNPGPQPWPNAHGSRSTLSGGLAAGRIVGTPVLISRGSEDLSMFTSPDWVNLSRQTRKNSTSESSMRRTIQDLVSSIDPNVKVEPEVEDLLLDIADEFIDSVANFSCKIAKHRGGDVLETKDLQLHLERNHNIRIPGFASDETRMSISQSSVPAAGGGGAVAGRRGGMTMTLRSARLNAVQAAKRDAKLL